MSWVVTFSMAKNTLFPPSLQKGASTGFDGQGHKITEKFTANKDDKGE